MPVLYKLTKAIIILMLLGLLALAGIFMYAYSQVELEADALINYSPDVSSEILDRHGERLAYVFKKRHRLYANYEEKPGYMIEALVAVEDTKFFEHNGVNIDAILRAIFKDIKARRFVEGGSTLTQQLVKNKLLTRKKTLMRKLNEAVLAIKIENKLSKEQILERYLNEIFFGNNYYGVKTAAFGYYHKRLEELSLKECAILMGLPKGPSYYNPLRHYKRALNRANAVLGRMRTIGWITETEYLKAVKEMPKVYKTSLTQNDAP
jgi:penicillin-binding protein 1A